MDTTLHVAHWDDNTEEDRAIRLEIRSKNARLLDAIEGRWGKIIDQEWNSRPNRGPRPVIRVAASLAQVSTFAMGGLLGMRRSAYNKKSGEPTESARKVAEALDEDMEHLFPPLICSESVPRTVRYLSAQTFLSLSEVSPRELLVASPDEQDEGPTLSEEFDSLFKRMKLRDGMVLKALFGFDGEPQTQRQIADRFAVTPNRIHQIVARAERELRHPSRSKRLRRFLK